MHDTQLFIFSVIQQRQRYRSWNIRIDATAPAVRQETDYRPKSKRIFDCVRLRRVRHLSQCVLFIFDRNSGSPSDQFSHVQCSVLFVGFYKIL